MSRRSFVTVSILLLATAALSAQVLGPRWQNGCRRIWKGDDKFITTAATFFGTEAHEEFVSVGLLPNGDIVAAGNTWGPDFPASPKPEILGKGKWFEVSEYESGAPTYKDKKGRVKFSDPAPDYPNRAGFIVVYSPDLQTIKRVVKFDWAVATIDQVCVLPDGDIVIGGRAQQAFLDDVAAKATKQHRYQPPDLGDIEAEFAHIKKQDKREQAIAKRRARFRKKYGPVYYQGVKMPGHAYLMRLSDLHTPDWVVILEEYRNLDSKLTVILDQYIAFSSNGVKRVDLVTGEPDYDYGGDNKRNSGSFNPQTGEFYTGGTSFSGTGREPYKNPKLNCYNPDGTHHWEAYAWDSAMVGHDRFRLVSDSVARLVMPDPEGYLWVTMWSDGGNSVASRNPLNILQGPRHNNPLGFSSWGATLGGFSNLVRFNPTTGDFDSYQFWSTFMPRTGAPNSIGISQMGVLQDSSMVLIGGAASCLVQTKHCFVTFPEYFWDQEYLNSDDAPGAGYGGQYCTIFNKNMTNVRFSSYLPKMSAHAFCDGPDDGFLLVSSAEAPFDDDTLEESWGVVPVKNAVQPDFGGGRMDGHILLMHDPEED